MNCAKFFYLLNYILKLGPNTAVNTSKISYESLPLQELDLIFKKLFQL